MEGLIFSVRRYSIHDGPGIRVTFFMKGCPLSCWWCHNPEGISPVLEQIEVIEKVGDKEFFRKENAGRYYSVGEVLSILERERQFIQQSGGGVTFSGGEPMMQPEFLAEALRECKAAGYHTAVDTSGQSLASNIESVMPYTDLYLFDLKHIDSMVHEKYTGVPNTLILSNLRLIAAAGKDLMIRIPVIPGINDDAETLEKVRSFLTENIGSSIKKVSLLPYHKTGSSKYKRLNMPDRMAGTEPPSAEKMKELKEFFSATGLKVKIGG
jgi:pyruvate formate lyase activating enzyme